MPYLLSEILRPFLNILLAIGIFIGIGYILRLLRKKVCLGRLSNLCYNNSCPYMDLVY